MGWGTGSRHLGGDHSYCRGLKGRVGILPRTGEGGLGQGHSEEGFLHPQLRSEYCRLPCLLCLSQYAPIGSCALHLSASLAARPV